MQILSELNKAIGQSRPGNTINTYEVEKALLDKIKLILRFDPEAVSIAVDYLIKKILSKSNEQNCKCLYILDFLFCRSDQFRFKLCENITFVNKIFPSEHKIKSNFYSEEFKNQIIHLIELWDLRYGKINPRLRSAARYLRESLGVSNKDFVVF
jgi:hypothetical protein